MRKLLTLLIALAAVVASASSFAQGFNGGGFNLGLLKPFTPATTTFDQSTANAGFGTLTNGNLTATNTASSGNQAVRSVASHSTGKFYHELHIDQLTADITLGIANATESMAFPVGIFDNDGIGNTSSGNVWLNGVNPTNSPVAGYATGDTISVAVDMGAKLIWFRTNAGNWNNNASGNPATGAFGLSFSTMNAGPWFAKAATSGHVGDGFTANFGATSYAQSVPAGFGNW